MLLYYNLMYLNLIFPSLLVQKQVPSQSKKFQKTLN